MPRPSILIASELPSTSACLHLVLPAILDDKSEPPIHKLEPPFTYRVKEELIDHLEQFAPEQLFNLVVLVYHSSEPVLSADEKPTVQEELILRFPEVYWIFVSPLPARGVPEGKTVSSKTIADMHFVTVGSMFDKLKGLIKRHKYGFRAIYDPTGLRRRILNAKLRLQLNLEEEHLGVSVEDETSFCLFNGYVLYRYGYNTHLVGTYAEMKNVLGSSNTVLSGRIEALKGASTVDGKLNIAVMEDVELFFPDPESEQVLEDNALMSRNKKACDLIDERKNKFPILGEQLPNGKGSIKRLLISFADEKAENWITKPYGGILDKRLDHLKLPQNLRLDNNTHHSAPGLIKQIVEGLLKRCNAIMDTDAGDKEISTALHAAVLAEDAYRLLNYKTPAIALQALSLKHEYEVRAEVSFLGVGHHFAIKPRLKELEQEIKNISGHFRKRRSAAEWDSLVSIANRLAIVFRGAGQFDEEAICMTHVRKWHRKLLKAQAKSLREKSVQAAMAYAEWLVISPRNFICALAGWFVMFWGLWYLINPSGVTNNLFWSTFSSAWNTFIATNPDKATEMTANILNSVAIASGLFHLGVFISYIYSTVARK